MDGIKEEIVANVPMDNVNHPKHYQLPNGLEAIDIIDAATRNLNGTAAVCTGNALKYILRWPNKNGVEDLKKARWYINHLIDALEPKTSR